MTFSINSHGITGDAVGTAERFQALANVLTRLAMGQLPSQTELLEAPLLTNWRLARRPALCLIGHCQDHPLLRGPRIVTSDLWVHGPDVGWSRTLSRFYRLGEPAVGAEPTCLAPSSYPN